MADCRPIFLNSDDKMFPTSYPGGVMHELDFPKTEEYDASPNHNNAIGLITSTETRSALRALRCTL